MKLKLFAIKVEIKNTKNLVYTNQYVIMPLYEWHECIKAYEPAWFEEKYVNYYPYEIKKKYQNEDIKKLLDKFYKNPSKFIENYCKKDIKED